MKLRAINLGGWFVLEYWMKPSLFEGLLESCHDETCFMEQHKDANTVLAEHHETWITKEDIIWIKTQGINLVRIPIPWWLFGEGIYHKTVDAIDKALAMIEEVGLDFMLDLHTAPGCQNGFDNGGIQHVLNWHKDKYNINKTIDILKEIMKRYNHLHHFHSIQVLNEPLGKIPMEIVQDFYIRSYHELRKINSQRTIVFHDSFRLQEWEGFFKNHSFHNVILDTHMYQCFDHSLRKFTIDQHCEYAGKRKKILANIEKFIPVIVGEWSLGMILNNQSKQDNTRANFKQYASAQLKAMRACTGHVFWSYRIDNDYDAWHFRKLVDEGIISMSEFLK